MSYLAESADVVSGECYQRENTGCKRAESGLWLRGKGEGENLWFCRQTSLSEAARLCGMAEKAVSKPCVLLTRS